MSSRPKQAEPRPAPRLYLVTPSLADTAIFAAELTAALAAADVAAVLLRLAEADERSLINQIKTLAPIAQAAGAALLIDGHADLVARGGADGAHLTGIEEFSAAIAQLKPERIAGVGGLPSRHDAMVAAESSADYVMFGEPQADFTLVEERVGWWADLFELPCVAYANSLDKIAQLVAAGADFIAVDFIWRDPRGVAPALTDIAGHLRLPELAQ
jgi:thiamine-phosphate pyrophosphorylase